MNENASSADSCVANRETGRRIAGAATAIAITAVRGCGRGIPRASQSANTRKSGGATVIRSRSAMWSTHLDANVPTSTTETTVQADAVATKAAAVSDSPPRAHSATSTPSAISGTPATITNTPPVCQKTSLADDPTS